MADLKLNGFLRRIRGASGDLVFKRVFGRMIVAQRPTPSPLPPSAGQLTTRTRFSAAAEYAQRVFADPVARSPYDAAARARNTSAFGLAVRDHMGMPEVREIDLAEYHGRIGDPIKVLAHDDFELVSVKVTLRDQNGNNLEEGPATLGLDGYYVYRATTVAPVDQTILVIAEAKDRPGRERELTEEWHA